jgi:uroporphyrinogen decarboxylase
MVEGGPSKNFSKIKGLMFDQPRLLFKLLEKITEAVTTYLNAQIAAGAQAIMVFDTWGGVLSSRDYMQFSLAYMQQIVENITNKDVPIILFTKDGNEWLENIAATGCDAVGLDWKLPIGLARQRIGDQVALQGNMDPCVLYASPDRIREEVASILASFGHGNGHVFNLGHGIHQHIDPDNVAVFIDAVHSLSAKYHTS